MTYSLPTRPWQMIGQDLFTLDGKNYLISVDYYSDYWELDYLTNTTGKAVVEATKAQFARYGIPELVISDNGPQFRAEEYSNFAKKWEFKHITSSPYHSQANGKAESVVKIVKRLMKKAMKDSQDIHLALLNWRNTPSVGKFSPVQKLHSRRTRTLLPTTNTLLQPEVPIEVTEEIELRRQRAKAYFDKGARRLPPLEIGETVRLQPQDKNGIWQKASIVKKVAERSYLVKTAEGHMFRRNRKFLRATGEVADEVLSQPWIPTEADEDSNSSEAQQSSSEPQGAEQEQSEYQPTAVSSSDVRQGSQEATAGTETVTRQGRVIRLPERLRDYVKL